MIMNGNERAYDAVMDPEPVIKTVHDMDLFLIKPDLMYYEQYNDMMREWFESKTRIAPWFLDRPFDTLDEFAGFIRMLDDCEHGIVDKQYAATTSFFVVDENDRLIGASSLRHYLTVEGYRTWGHIGYGVRPSERRKGYAVKILGLMLEQARLKNMRRVLLGAYEGNIGSCKTIEKCGGILENTVKGKYDEEPIRRYWISISSR